MGGRGTMLGNLGEAVSAIPTDAATVSLVLLFWAVVLGVLAVGRLLKGRAAVARRAALTSSTVRGSGTGRLRADDKGGLWRQVLAGLERRAVPLNEAQRTTARLRLMRAGFMEPGAVRAYFALRLLFATGLPAGFLWALFLSGREMAVESLTVVVTALLAAGFYLPSVVVWRKTRRRQAAVQDGFPDALDMLTVCVEAGLSLDSALTRVGSHMMPAYPILAQEFALVSLELRAGKSREAALHNLAERVGLDEIASFVVLLVQSDQLGTSIAQTLRVQAEEMRVKRLLRAEEKAHTLPVKLSVPLVLCLLPAMAAVAVLPGVIRVLRELAPALAG